MARDQHAAEISVYIGDVHCSEWVTGSVYKKVVRGASCFVAEFIPSRSAYQHIVEYVRSLEALQSQLANSEAGSAEAEV